MNATVLILASSAAAAEGVYKTGVDERRGKVMKEYAAVINNTDPIRVRAASLESALRQIASHCDQGETFLLLGVQYVVNGKLNNEAVSRA